MPAAPASPSAPVPLPAPPSVGASAVEDGDGGEPLHRALGLTDAERDAVEGVLGRPPNRLELALFSVMWSEHCSYKSSRVHLRRLPTDGPGVLVGPGENAGVLDAGDGIAVAIRIESHNHPSAVEPYQGAATGVGGILRDIFTMGARPLAVLDPLFFGPLTEARQRWLLEGVVSGISGYGNSVGVPTVGGELTFDPCYTGNPLVNVACLGALPVERLVLGRASGEGNLAVLLGSATGRDGIGGVSVLASAGFEPPHPGHTAGVGLGPHAPEEGGVGAPPGSSDTAGVGLGPHAPEEGGVGAPPGSSDTPRTATDKRPSVQVGDPFEEKRLIEACLALLDEGLVVGIQDLGGAGLACATSETAARGGMGMDVDVTAVPRREPGMTSWEVMTSESQERMLAIVTPEHLEAVVALCRRWEVRAAVVGRVTRPEPDAGGRPVGRLRVRDGMDGPVLADVPAAALADEAPLYHRPLAPPAHRPGPDADPALVADPGDSGAALLSLLADPSWVYRQYDHELFLNTVEPPGGDAALLRLAGPGLPPSQRAMAVTTDAAPRWCALDPRRGTALVVAEAVANLACVGARAAAIVNCLNFGNPEHPEVMWQLSEAVDGMAEACRALGLPVIGGNVSLYNESGGRDILPTPVVGALGLVDRLVARPPGVRLEDGASLVLLGARAAPGAAPYPLGGSRWAVEVHDRRGGELPPLDLDAHRRLVAMVTELVAAQVAGGPPVLCGVHDVSGGGLAVALAELAVATGTGCRVRGVDGHAELFTELPSRVVVATHDPDAVVARAGAARVPAAVIGVAGGDRLVVEGVVDLDVAGVHAAWRDRLPDVLGGVVAGVTAR